ncbi:MAG TPA: twin-arginine translocation signal domain-containing protein, partial [Roseiflexaceae bacterium]|nr:twin-arginine translocation signal domain-containing protein [Roseiflexaceae bacterium]
MKQTLVSRRSFLRLAALGAAGAALAACGQAPVAQQPAQGQPPAGGAPAAGGGKLEIFSWWTSGGEVEALNALYAIYKQKYPNVEIINAALAGGAGAG